MSKVRTLSMADLTSENMQRWAMEGKGPLTSCVVESQGWCQVEGNGKRMTFSLMIDLLLFLFSMLFR